MKLVQECIIKSDSDDKHYDVFLFTLILKLVAGLNTPRLLLQILSKIIFKKIYFLLISSEILKLMINIVSSRKFFYNQLICQYETNETGIRKSEFFFTIYNAMYVFHHLQCPIYIVYEKSAEV